jgi:hypothetical protein
MDDMAELNELFLNAEHFIQGAVRAAVGDLLTMAAGATVLV